MDLIIAEKPDIAKAITKVLPGNPQRKQGYFEQGNYCITWCYGHLLTLKEPEDYGKEYERKNTPNSALPIFFDNWGMKVGESGKSLLKNGSKAPDKKVQLNIIGSLLKKASLVIIAGDVDDEGQLLVEEIMEWFKYKGPVKRLDTGALNEASLKKAMANLMDNDSWHMRAVSARARTVADFALGINGSRFFSNIYNANLSVGRVQTATLGLVVARDAQIEDHTTTKYYLLDADAALRKLTGTHTVRFTPNPDFPGLVDGKMTDKVFLEKFAKTFEGMWGRATITKEIVYENPPLPFSISALKSYCSSKYNIDPEETLQITQSLRMNYGGLITYNRSECRYLPENMHAEAPDVIAAVQMNLGSKWNFKGLDSSIVSKAFDDKNVGVHHAIIPTTQIANMEELTENELKVYKAICGFYMVQFMPPAKKERTVFTSEVPRGKFAATSVKILDKGFKAVMETKPDSETELSNVPAGNYDCKFSNPKISEAETKPPRRYTDASLEEDMKSVAKYVTDPEAKRLLLLKDKGSKEENGSIGTAATRSAIIQTLKKRSFLRNEGKYVVSTEIGRKFYNILPDEIRKPDLTARWWAIQQDIQEGKAKPEDLYKELLASYGRFSSQQYPSMNLSLLFAEKPEKGKSKGGKSGKNNSGVLGKCPKCGKPVYENKAAYYCSGWRDGCKFTLWKEGSGDGDAALKRAGKKLTPTMITELLESGSFHVTGIKNKNTGKTFSADFMLTESTQGKPCIGIVRSSIKETTKGRK